MNIDIKITPGEWLDRFTILQVKLANIKDEEKVQALALRVQAEWPNLETWHAGRVAEALKSIPVLTSIHQRLWWLENRVRTDDPDFTVAELYNFYSEITELNDKRAALKAKLDEGVPFAEVKEHKNVD